MKRTPVNIASAEQARSTRAPADMAVRHGDGWPFAVRLSAALIGLVLACGSTLFIVAQRSARVDAYRMADELFDEVSRRAVDQTQHDVTRVTPILLTCQSLAQQGLLNIEDDDRFARQLLAMLQANEGVSWISYADAAGRFTGVTRSSEGALGINQSHIGADGRTRLVESAVNADGTWRVVNEDADSGYDPRRRPFYTAAVAARGTAVWLEPYIFFGQNVPGVTTAAAVVRDGAVAGVFTVDFLLETLTSRLAALRAGERSKLVLFTESGDLIARGQRAGESGQPVERALARLGDADPLSKAFADALDASNAGARQHDGRKRFRFEFEGMRYLASAAAFDLSGGQRWVIGIFSPEADFMAGVWRTQRHVAVACVIILGLTIVLAVLMSRLISKPISALCDQMMTIGSGDLDAHASLGGAREFRQLSRSLNRMVADLRDGLRLRHSIGVAMQVQKQLLPGSPPVVRGLDVSGYSKYCDETGGDYYDFITAEAVGADRLMIVVGDVMGHGVGSALVMAGARAVLRDRASEAGSLAILLDRLNALVNEDSRGKQFMTMSLGVIDAAAGTYRLASAGHDPAILYRAATGQFEEVDEAGLPLGVMDDGMYAERVVDGLAPGDVLLLGTDGIWESTSPTGEQFGKDRLRQVILDLHHDSADRMATEIVDRLSRYRAIPTFDDDVTFVLVKFGEPRGASDRMR